MEDPSSLMILFQNHGIRETAVEEFLNHGILSVDDLGRKWSLEKGELEFAFHLKNVTKASLLKAFEEATEEYFQVLPIQLPSNDFEGDDAQFNVLPSSSPINDEIDDNEIFYERQQMGLNDSFSLERERVRMIYTDETESEGVSQNIMLRFLQTIEQLENQLRVAVDMIDDLQSQINSLKPLQLKVRLQDIQMKRMQEEINQLKLQRTVNITNEKELKPETVASNVESHTADSIYMTAVLPLSRSPSPLPDNEPTNHIQKKAEIPDPSSLSCLLQSKGFASDLSEQCEEIGLTSLRDLIEADENVILQLTKSLKAIPRKKFQAFLKSARLGEVKEDSVDKGFGVPDQSIEETRTDLPLPDTFSPLSFDIISRIREVNVPHDTFESGNDFTMVIEDTFINENPIAAKRNSELYPFAPCTKKSEIAEEYKVRQELSLEEELQKWCKGNKLPPSLFNLLKEEKINSLHALLLAEESVIKKICGHLKPIPAKKLRIAYEQKNVYYDYYSEEEEEDEADEEVGIKLEE